jgi:hypothetical protein
LVLADNGICCIAGSERVSMSSGGSAPTLAALCALRSDAVRVTGYCATACAVRAGAVARYLPRGRRACVRLTLADGRTLTCTPEHRLLAHDGKWRRADTLTRVAVTAESSALHDDELGGTAYVLRVGALSVSCRTPELRERARVVARLLGAAVGCAHSAAARDRFELLCASEADAADAYADVHTLEHHDGGSACERRARVVVVRGALGVAMRAAQRRPCAALAACARDNWPRDVRREYVAAWASACLAPPVLCDSALRRVRLVRVRSPLSNGDHAQHVRMLSSMFGDDGLRDADDDGVIELSALSYAACVGVRYNSALALRVAAAAACERYAHTTSGMHEVAALAVLEPSVARVLTLHGTAKRGLFYLDVVACGTLWA